MTLPRSIIGKLKLVAMIDRFTQKALPSFETTSDIWPLKRPLDAMGPCVYGRLEAMFQTYLQPAKAFKAMALGASMIATLTITSGGFAQSKPQITGPIDASNLVTLKGNTHPLARAQYDLGPASTSGRMLLVFKRSAQQEAKLQQLLHDQQNATSPSFHKWLTPDQFGARFGIAEDDLQAVTGYLQEKGFSVGKVTKGRMSVEITGSSEQIQQAFHTQIHRYAVNGNEFTANDRDPMIPGALAPVVAGFASLNNFKASRSSALKQVVFDPTSHTVTPLDTRTVGTTKQYAVTPGDLANIYKIPAQTKSSSTAPSIGVISDSNINLSNIAAYKALFKLTSSVPSIIVDGEDPGITSDALTTTAEVELINGVAPYTTVNLYTSASSDYDVGNDFAILRAVGDDSVNILDVGFTNCEAALGVGGNEFASAVWEQAAAQGMTVISATGDAGAAGCDTPGGTAGFETSALGAAVSGWATTPYNTAVGGTDFYYAPGLPPTTYWNNRNSATPVLTSAIGPIPQQPWNDSNQSTDALTLSPTPLYAGGGGPSTLGYQGVSGYTIPTWQTAALNGQATSRSVPDLSLFAGDQLNSSYYILCFASTDCASGTTSTFTTTGGTAVAASVFAGIVAQIVQLNSAQGNINPQLYSLASTSTSASFASATAVFNDVTTGSNYVACALLCVNGVSLDVDGITSTYIGAPAASGYDLASGLGTINATNLINDWPNINAQTAPSSVIVGVSTSAGGPALASGATVTHGSFTYFNSTVTPPIGKVTPTGDVAILSTDYFSSDRAIEWVTLVNGSGNDTPLGTQLPGGTYALTANYAGDTNYAPAVSAPFTITVNPEPSQVIIMSASAQPITSTGYITNLNYSLITSPNVSYGTPVRITVEPFGFDGNSVGIPSGSIAVSDNGAVIASVPLNSEGAATFQSSTLAVGAHSFTFAYAGDVSYLPSTSLQRTGGSSIPNSRIGGNQTPIAFTIGSAATHTVLSTNNSDLFVSGGTSTLTAVVSSASTISTGFAPTGQVDFSFVDGNGNRSDVYVNVTPSYDTSGNLVATATENVSATGTYTAIFVPTGNFLTSTGNSVLISESVCDIYCTTTNSTVTLTTTTGANIYTNSSDLVFNIQVTATPLYFGFIQSGIYTNQVSGTVGIFANGVQIGLNVALNPNTGFATFTVPKNGDYLQIPSGSVTFSAAYSGGNATAGLISFAAEPAQGADTLTIQGNSQGNPSAPGKSGDFSLQALQPALLMPTGTTGSIIFPLQLTATSDFLQNYSGSNIAFTCASPTVGLTCTLSATSLSLSTGTTSIGFNTLTATIKPAANYTVARNEPPASAPRSWLPYGGVAMGCVLLLGIPARRRGWQAMLSLLFVCLVGLGINGCANDKALGSPESQSASTTGSSGNKPTSVLPGNGPGVIGTGNGFTPDVLLTLPTGSYPVTVTGTVTLNGVVITHNAILNVIVQ